MLAKGFKAFKLDPFGTAQGFISREELELAYDICRTLRDELPADTLHPDRRACPLHRDRGAAGGASAFADLDIYWWEEPTTRDRQETVHEVAHRSPDPGRDRRDVRHGRPVLHAGRGRRRQHLPARADVARRHRDRRMQVANLALAHGSYIAPHQSGGPVATAVCLQLAACVPNFLIQEHFDAFNEPWTRELVTWHPTIDPANGHLSLPDAPGLGIDLNIEAIKRIPTIRTPISTSTRKAGRSGSGTDADNQGAR